MKADLSIAVRGFFLDATDAAGYRIDEEVRYSVPLAFLITQSGDLTPDDELAFQHLIGQDETNPEIHDNPIIAPFEFSLPGFYTNTVALSKLAHPPERSHGFSMRSGDTPTSAVGEMLHGSSLETLHVGYQGRV